ncbi:hypothetical protein [Aquimarina sp. RZ0]|uniref:hypothetical protein n=1 Tax=Aquimarina sp. RZ0 TaxID=2607730 RepID=UPI0011F3222D|nr:hypothetical protein [Aquimarina sp. RZ0]KAA1243381.1 hypothetical protein F0000_21220 [Aquimarina sp. RZ0]
MSIISKIYLLSVCLTSLLIISYPHSKNEFSNDQYEIISLLLESLSAGPPPPPPAPGVYSKDTLVFNKYSDSINRLDVSIVVLDHFIKSEEIPVQQKVTFEKKFQKLIETLEKNEIDNSKINFDSIMVSDNRKIMKTDKAYRGVLEDNNASHYIAFSNVILNKDKDNAVIYFINNRGALSGTTSLVLLDKKNGKWKIYKRIVLSLS